MDKSTEQAKEALKALAELEENSKVKSKIKDNKIYFKSGNKEFRLRKPNIQETDEVEELRVKKLTEFIEKAGYFFRKQWIEKYKKKGIDIVKMENEVRRLAQETKKLLLTLATTKNKNSINNLKKEIVRLRGKQVAVSMEITDLLSCSIENQLQMATTSYTAYLVLENKVNDKWIKYFKTYGDFNKCDDNDLVNKIFVSISELLFTPTIEGKDESGSN